MFSVQWLTAFKKRKRKTKKRNKEYKDQITLDIWSGVWPFYLLKACLVSFFLLCLVLGLLAARIVYNEENESRERE